MYVVREIMHCRPGKVRDMVTKFQTISAIMERMGYEPFRLMTDVSGERFWTVVAETDVESIDSWRQLEDEVMSDPTAQAAMAGYHDLVVSGGREIYRLEE